VSVLFADLVGFRALSESRDAEEVRELLSRYFETCRRLVERYGGTVEKFIGDAVMAVWGTPTASEDDAERAVRTALDLIAAAAGIRRRAECRRRPSPRPSRSSRTRSTSATSTTVGSVAMSSRRRGSPRRLRVG
jgi:class 3 adenylate cyclase